MTDPIQTLSHRTVGLPLRARIPYATYVLVVANVAVLVATKVAGEGLHGWVLDRLAQDRLEVWHGEWWRLLTATFVHEGWGHLLLNMLLLLSVGGPVERLLGAWRFTVLYLVSGLSGALCFQAFASGSVGIGASGAILGVFGAYLLAWATATSRNRRAARWKLLRWAVFLVLADFTYSYVMEKMGGILVASSAHAGGLAAGVLLGRFFAIGEDETGQVRAGRIAALVCLVLLLGGVGAYAFWGQNPRWPEMEGIRDLERIRISGDAEAAVKSWKDLDLKGAAKREVGYFLWDQLMADGRDAAAAARLLEDLILSAGEEHDALRRKKTESPELANELAWYLALQGTDLPRALTLADHAVRRLEGRIGGLSGFLGGNRVAGTCINTRGWVLFLFGETETGLRDLRSAADLNPIGPNFLYLAIAHARLGNIREAREAGQRAGEEDGLSPYERRLLEELKENVGGF